MKRLAKCWATQKKNTVNLTLIGKQFGQCLKDIPETTFEPLFWRPEDRYGLDQAFALLVGFPRTVTTSEGRCVLLHNLEHGSLKERATHLATFDWRRGINPGKARWFPNVPGTLENAQFCIEDTDTSNWLYGLRYHGRDIHLVVIKPKRNPESPIDLQGYLITQMPFDPGGRQRYFRVRWVNLNHQKNDPDGCPSG